MAVHMVQVRQEMTGAFIVNLDENKNIKTAEEINSL